MDKSLWFVRLKRKILSRVWLARGLLVAGVIIVLILFVYAVKSLLSFSFAGRFAWNFLFPNTLGISSYQGRTNFLILGKGGAGHDSPDLTDTIMFVSLPLDKTQTKEKLVVVSIPRDIWVASIRAKINSAYYWGNQKKEGGGLILAKSLVEEIVGVPIHYGVVFDFSSFKEIIDVVGGVNVNVERSFTDEKYPIAGRENDECEGDVKFSCRYETLYFVQGKQIMGGETALKFVRSRNAQGDEGTDLARGMRQQKVISAIKDRILSFKFLLSFDNVKKSVNVVLKNIETDIKEESFPVIARKIFSSKNFTQTYTISSELLSNPSISPRYDNQYVFVPKAEDWGEVQSWIKSQLE